MGLFGGHPLEAETGFGWVPPESREEVPPESREEETREEEAAIEGRDKNDNNRVHAARLYDKLDQLERKWLSQKTQKRVKGPNKRARASSSSRSSSSSFALWLLGMDRTCDHSRLPAARRLLRWRTAARC